MASKKSFGLIEFWTGTIIGAVIIGFSAQTLLFTLGNELALRFDQPESGEGFSGTPSTYIWSQVIAGLLGILVGIVVLAVRKPRAK